MACDHNKKITAGEVMAISDKNIVVIGGGTGSFTMLSGLKRYTKNLTAIVSMADDGGSTGVLRDELGVLPPGDVRQCLVALSRSPKMRELFNYRFDEGTFDGHSFGNILLTALEKATGSFSEAVKTASQILRIDGKVLPATLDNVRLKMIWDDDSVTLHGERVIDADFFKHDPRAARLALEPAAQPNPAALEAIRNADLVVIAPGDLYTSLGPLLIIEGFGSALMQTKATVAYVCNLVTKEGQTDGFSVDDHVREIERFAGTNCVHVVLYNDQEPTPTLLSRYQQEHAYLVKNDTSSTKQAKYKAIAGKFLGDIAKKEEDTLPVTRSLIRHDTKNVCEALITL
jgi:uncharacterized cofD-like protein